jgi:hypothetical protein
MASNLAHTIKGSFGYFEARGGYEAALELEAAAKSHDWSFAGESLQRLLEAWRFAEPELRAFYMRKTPAHEASPAAP